LGLSRYENCLHSYSRFGLFKYVITRFSRLFDFFLKKKEEKELSNRPTLTSDEDYPLLDEGPSFLAMIDDTFMCLGQQLREHVINPSLRRSCPLQIGVATPHLMRDNPPHPLMVVAEHISPKVIDHRFKF
jgi:hypothetical protein